MHRPPRAFLLLAVVSALLLVEPAASVTPLAPSGIVPLGEAGLYALEARLRFDELYGSGSDGVQFFVRDQMMGVIAAVNAVSAHPTQAKAWQTRAQDLWSSSEESWVAESSFYGTLIPRPDPIRCIDVDTNAWALEATQRLTHPAVGSAFPDAPKRLGALRGTLVDLLSSPSSDGQPVCPRDAPAVPARSMPILLLCLLDTVPESGGAASNGALRQAVSTLILTNKDGAYPLSENTYSASHNAQMLVVLTKAAKVFGDPTFATARDRLASWLYKNAVHQEGSDLLVSDLELKGGVLSPLGNSPSGQIWLLHALGILRQDNASAADATTMMDLSRAYLTHFWVPDPPGFASTQSTVVFEFNALPAVLLSAPVLRDAAVDPSTYGFVVPSKQSYAYPALGSAEASQLYLNNSWPFRFSVSNPAAPQDILLAAPVLAPYNLTPSRDAGFPEARVFRSSSFDRTEVPREGAAKDPNLVWFTAPRANVAGYRFDGFVPLEITRSDFRSTIAVTFRSFAPAPLVVNTLQIELEARDISIRTATLNNVPLGSVEVVESPATEAVQRPHVRLFLRDVQLPANAEAELIIGYNDVVAPSISEVLVSRDLAGKNLIGREGTVSILQGEKAYVRARVDDNGALRSVQLRLRLQAGNLDLQMSEVPDEPGVYAAEMPTEGETGVGSVQVVAVDAASTGNLNQSVPLSIEIQNPLFAGSIVLFVFSGTLFITAFVIWIKVRRKFSH